MCPDASSMLLGWISWRSLICPLVREDSVLLSWRPSIMLFNLCVGNKSYASYVVKSNEIKFAFTAPYPMGIDKTGTTEPHPNFSAELMHRFILSKKLIIAILKQDVV